MAIRSIEGQPVPVPAWVESAVNRELEPQDLIFVVVGMGAVTPLGHTLEETWQHIKEGQHGVIKLDNPITSRNDVIKVGAPVKNFDLLVYFNRQGIDTSNIPFLSSKNIKGLALATHYSIAAHFEALKAAKLITTDLCIDPYITNNLGVEVEFIGGTDIGTQNEMAGVAVKRHERSRSVGPSDTLIIRPDAIFSNTSAAYNGIHGVRTLNAACATGNLLFSEAVRSLTFSALEGLRKVVIIGDSEAAIREHDKTQDAFALDTFNRLNGAINSTDDPNNASVPFRDDRNGIVFASGAGAMAITSLRVAQELDLSPLAVVASSVQTSSGRNTHPTNSDWEAQALAMHASWRKAGIDVQHPNGKIYVSGHATSTISEFGDVAEALALLSVLGPDNPYVDTILLKQYLAHMLSVSGIVESEVMIKGMEEGITIPNTHLKKGCLMPEATGLNLPINLGQQRYKATQVNNFGFVNIHSSTTFLNTNY